jgi:small-conductance mechanosensitive channel
LVDRALAQALIARNSMQSPTVSPAPAPPISELVTQMFTSNSLSQLLTALAVFIGGTLLLGIAKRVIQFRLAKIAERTETQVDDLVVDLIRRTSRIFLATVAFRAGLAWLTLGTALLNDIHLGLMLVVWLQVGLWARGLVQFGIEHVVRAKMGDDPARTMGISVLAFLSQVVVWSVVLLLCLESIGAPVTSLIASLGVGGIAVALAAQNVLGDLFASIAILLDKPFIVGDAIVLGDFQGTVERIGVKTTRLRSVTGEQIVIGNHDLVSSRLRNFKRLVERRNVLAIGVSYATPYEKVALVPSMLEEIVRSTPDTRFDRAHFKALGDSALMYELVYFVIKADYGAFMDAQQTINLKILRRLADESIDLAFPTQVVHLVRPTGKTASASAGASSTSAPRN